MNVYNRNRKGGILSGQIRYVDFSQGEVALQGGIRPALIVQNDKGCKFSPRIWVIPLTSRTDKASNLPMHVFIAKTDENGLKCDSVALVEQAQFVLRDKIGNLVGKIDESDANELGKAWIRNCSGMFSPQIIAMA